ENPVFRLRPSDGSLLPERGEQGYFRIAASADGWFLATARARMEKDESIHEVDLWQAHVGGNMRTVSLDPGLRVRSIAVANDGKALGTGAATDPDVRVKGGDKVKGELRLVPLSR